MTLYLKKNVELIQPKVQGLQILQGFYGADGSWRDVTNILQKAVKGDVMQVSWTQPYAEIGGDPAYLRVKTLVVSYRLDGQTKIASFAEQNPPVGLRATIPVDPNTHSDLPPASLGAPVRTLFSPGNAPPERNAFTGLSVAQLAELMQNNAKAIGSTHQPLQILQGCYGADGAWRDVTDILKKSVKGDVLHVSWNQPYAEIGGDPAWLKVKTLIIAYRSKEQFKLATFEEQNYPVGLEATIR